MTQKNSNGPHLLGIFRALFQPSSSLHGRNCIAKSAPKYVASHLTFFVGWGLIVVMLLVGCLVGNAQSKAHQRAHQAAREGANSSELIAKNVNTIDKESIIADIKHDVSTAVSADLSAILDDVVKEGKSHLGKKYVHGTHGPKTFDCSGFTGYVYKQFGYNITYDPRAQYARLTTDVKRTELRKGDLVFFSKAGPNGRISHVGMVVSADGDGNFQFIHASCSRGITISSINERYYTSKYVGARRVITE